jgi:hypothetical protein
VALGDTEPGLASRGLRSTVSVPVADVMRAEVRRLDRGRTGVFVGGSAFVAYLVTRWAFDVLDPTKDPNDGGEGGVDNARVVMFRLRW